MATTTNFGWETPDDTDLVKDGAAAMRTLGNSIDTSFVDLKGGTTGQILAKASNTDLDYTWITNDIGDITEVAAGTGISGGGTSGAVTITNSMATAIDAKGDLIAGTGADAFSRLAVGANDTVLTADSSTATGLKWATPASGGMTLLSSTSISSTSTTISDISQSYKNLYIEVINPISTSSTPLSFKWGVANAIQSNSYFWYGFAMPMNAGASVVNKSAATGYFDPTNGDTITAGNASKNLVTFYIPSYTVGSFHPVQVYSSLYYSATTWQSSFLAAHAQQQGAVNCFRVDFGAGTCTGTINVYGVK